MPTMTRFKFKPIGNGALDLLAIAHFDLIFLLHKNVWNSDLSYEGNNFLHSACCSRQGRSHREH